MELLTRPRVMVDKQYVSTFDESDASTEHDLLIEAIAKAPADRRRREAPEGWQQFTAPELAEILDDAYAAEVQQLRSGAEIPKTAERDSGLRFLTGLLIGIPVGLAIWGAVIAAIVVLA